MMLIKIYTYDVGTGAVNCPGCACVLFCRCACELGQYMGRVGEGPQTVEPLTILMIHLFKIPNSLKPQIF